VAAEEENQIIIDGRYTVREETKPLPPPREPIFGPWRAIVAFAGFLLLQFFIALARRPH
jgi:hypothetical protein